MTSARYALEVRLGARLHVARPAHRVVIPHILPVLRAIWIGASMRSARRSGSGVGIGAQALRSRSSLAPRWLEFARAQPSSLWTRQTQVALAEHDAWSSSSRRTLPTQRSATPFCEGLRYAVLVGLMPKDFHSRDDLRREDRVPIEDEVPRSRVEGNASRSCWTTHEAARWSVTANRRTRPRPCSIANQTCIRRNVTVGTAKKFMAAIASRWVRRNTSQRATASGQGRRRGRCRETVHSETSKRACEARRRSLALPKWDSRSPSVG